MALRAVDEFPDAAAYWNTLGVAHYRAGDDHAAVAALDRARTLGGGTAFDDVFLAMAHARLGDPAEARQALARQCSRRNATTRATPSWPASATRPAPSSPATPVPRSRSVDAAGRKE